MGFLTFFICVLIGFLLVLSLALGELNIYFFAIGAWASVCIFLIWKKRRIFLHDRRVLTYMFRFQQTRHKFVYRIRRARFSAFKSVLIAGAVLLGAFFSLPLFFHIQLTVNDTSSIFLTFSQLLTTIFAITVSVTLIGVQYLAQAYTPRSVRNYFRDSFFAGFVIVYIFSILLNLFLAFFSSEVASHYLFESFTLLIFCLVYLVAYPFHEIDKLQPTQFLRRITADIPKNLFKILSDHDIRSKEVNNAREPFIVMEQVIIQSIRNNDYDFYSQCVGSLTRTTIKLIDAAKTEYGKTKDLDLLASRTDMIVQFSYRFFNQLKIESFKTKNEIFHILLLEALEEYIIKLHEAEAIRALPRVYDLHLGIGTYSLENRLEALAEEYCRSIERLSMVELKLDEFKIPPFQPDFGKTNPSSMEYKIEIFNLIMSEYFTSQRLNALRDAVKLASDSKMSSEVSLLMFDYSHLLDKIIEFKNPNYRSYLLRTVLFNLEEAYVYAAERKEHVSFQLLDMLQYKVKRMREIGVTEQEILYLSDRFCYFGLVSVKNDDFGAVQVLGYQGRVMSSKNEPKIAVMLAQTLGEALKINANNPKLVNITEEEIKKQLDSIKKWNNLNNKEINNTVDKLLNAEYGFPEDVY